jgi:hypothetical protein
MVTVERRYRRPDFDADGTIMTGFFCFESHVAHGPDQWLHVRELGKYVVPTGSQSKGSAADDLDVVP